jgi:hypothetical protein
MTQDRILNPTIDEHEDEPAKNDLGRRTCQLDVRRQQLSYQRFT